MPWGNWADGLSVTRLEFELAVERPMRLPDRPGSMLRGAVASALKEKVCVVADGDCPRCALRPGCPYARVFEPARPAGVEAFRGEAQVPPPYVIREIDRDRELEAGGRFRFGVNLIGRACDLAGHVVEAVRLGARGGLGVARVPAVVAGAAQWNGEVVPLDRARLAAGLRPETVRELAARAGGGGGEWKEVEIRFETPAKIVAGGTPKVRPTGPQVLRALLRRVGALAAFHGAWPVGWEEVEALVNSAATIAWECSDVRWEHAERWSNRQRRKVPVGGIVGRYVFLGGDVQRLWRLWLVAGAHLHVGKNASFGLGRYSVTANGGGR